METIRVLKLWFDTVQNIAAHNWGFLLLIPVIYALRKIKVRRPRTWDVEETPWDVAETPPDEETLSREQKKGQRGEDFIEQILYDTVPGEFEIFRNVYVPNGDTTSEIDLLMVHEKGIFVFESKNYSGWIFGSAEQVYWTKMFPGREKYSFYNPVRQNQTHIKALMRYLELPGNCFYSCIVFSDRCTLKKVPGNTYYTVITQSSQLPTVLKHLFSKSPISYSQEEIGAIAERLLPLVNVDSSVKEKHVADIRAAQESSICPWCGKPLVLREGRYGSFFWGCTSYPRCKFIRKV